MRFQMRINVHRVGNHKIERVLAILVQEVALDHYRCVLAIYDQNFDESFGHWQTNGRLREHIMQGFKRRRGRGPFRDTGPSKDHSTGSGKKIYVSFRYSYH